MPCCSEGEEIVSTQQLGGSAITHPSGSRQNRDDEFDLENIMLMEAIWLSFQEDGKRHRSYGDAAQLAKYAAELRISAAMAPQAESTSSSSPSGGLACTIARQQVGGESSTNGRFSGGAEMVEGGGYDDWSTVDNGGGRSTGAYPLHDDMAMEMENESFEEQMMIAMAVSLSEARTRTASPEIQWH